MKNQIISIFTMTKISIRFYKNREVRAVWDDDHAQF